MFYIKRLFNSFTNYFYNTSETPDIQNSIEKNELELSRNKSPVEYSNNDISEWKKATDTCYSSLLRSTS